MGAAFVPDGPDRQSYKTYQPPAEQKPTEQKRISEVDKNWIERRNVYHTFLLPALTVTLFGEEVNAPTVTPRWPWYSPRACEPPGSSGKLPELRRPKRGWRTRTDLAELGNDCHPPR